MSRTHRRPCLVSFVSSRYNSGWVCTSTASAFRNFRTFRDVEIDLIHPNQDFGRLNIPKPRLSNLNLLLGNNGQGKSAFLKGVALAALGPAVGDAGIFPYRLVRREPQRSKATAKSKKSSERPQSDARLFARFRPHEQDHVPKSIRVVESDVGIEVKGDLEKLTWRHTDEKLWNPIFQAASDAFFFVGYGAARHVEPKERVDLATRQASSFIRAQRVQSLFRVPIRWSLLRCGCRRCANRIPGASCRSQP
jgi:hypothetical protein